MRQRKIEEIEKQKLPKKFQKESQYGNQKKYTYFGNWAKTKGKFYEGQNNVYNSKKNRSGPNTQSNENGEGRTVDKTEINGR